MKKNIAILAIWLGLSSAACAQATSPVPSSTNPAAPTTVIVQIGCLNGSNQTVSCPNPLPVTGGFNVLDQAAFTAAASIFAPSGCEYNAANLPLASGQQGTVACDINRQQRVVEANSAAILNAVQSPIVPSITGFSVPINISTATTTQLVALSGTTSIYVTSYEVMAGGTGNFTFEYGTGSACATGTTILTGAYPMVAQAKVSRGDGTGTVIKIPAGNALCALTSGAVQMSGSLTYVQQ